MVKSAYPITKSSMQEYAKTLFAPILRSECSTSIWVPIAGRRVQTEFIIDNIEDFKEHLPDHKHYILVYVDSLNLTNESSLGYLRLMFESAISACVIGKRCGELANKYQSKLDSNGKKYSTVLKDFKKFLKELSSRNYKIVFFLAEFDDQDWLNTYFFGNLKAIWNEIYPDVQYVFLLREDVKKRRKVYMWRDLNQLVLQNVTYSPLFSIEDSIHIIKSISGRLNIVLSKDEIKEILNNCGGHPYMIYVGVKEIETKRKYKFKRSEFVNHLTNHHTMNSIINAILDVFDDTEKSILKKVALNQRLTLNEVRLSATLEKLNIISNPSGIRRIYNEVLREGILQTSYLLDEGRSNISIDLETSQVLLDEKSVEDKFTIQEHAVLAFLIKNSNIIVSREEIAKVIWMDKIDEKYSDWAIDQLMSKTRRKLKKLGADSTIATVRGKGYKYTVS